MFASHFGASLNHELLPIWQATGNHLRLLVPAHCFQGDSFNGVVFGHKAFPGRTYARAWVDDHLKFIFDGHLTYQNELRGKLALSATEAQTEELLLSAAYRKWGRDCIKHVHGDFSLTVWDSRSLTIWVALPLSASCAKPIYWAQLANGFVLASVMPLVKMLPGIDKSLDFDALTLLVTSGLMASGATSYRSIKKLRPGHELVWSPGKPPQITRWWNLSPSTVEFSSPEEHAEHLALQFEAAVAETLIGGAGPVAAHISGGLDSTLSASFAAKAMQGQGRTLYAWTQCATPGIKSGDERGREGDEWPVARLVSQQYNNIVHEKFCCGSPCLIEQFVEQHSLLETPVRNSVNAQWLIGIAREAQKLGCEAVITGFVGNLSVSYQPDRQASTWAYMKAGKMSRAFKIMRSGGWKEPARLLRYCLKGGGLSQESSRSFRIPGLNFSSHTKMLIDDELSSLKREMNGMIIYPFLTISSGFVADERYLTGVEHRDPTGDRKVLEAVHSLPLDAFFMRHYGRAQARLIGGDIVPDAIRWRTRRGLQGAEQAGYFSLYRSEYSAAWAMVQKTNLPELFGRVSLGRLAAQTLSGAGDFQQAAFFFRLLDVGLFVAKSGQDWPVRK
jgi:asparagine synthase (glutamine-hydrolysing)